MTFLVFSHEIYYIVTKSLALLTETTVAIDNYSTSGSFTDGNSFTGGGVETTQFINEGHVAETYLGLTRITLVLYYPYFSGLCV